MNHPSHILFSKFVHRMAFILQINLNPVFCPVLRLSNPFASLVIFTQNCKSGFASLQLKVLCEFKELQTKH